VAELEPRRARVLEQQPESLELRSCVLSPVSHYQLSGIIGAVAYGMGGGAEYIAEPIGNLDLTIGAQESSIVFRLTVQHDGVRRRCFD
jgi:hypothetical protein